MIIDMYPYYARPTSGDWSYGYYYHPYPYYPTPIAPQSPEDRAKELEKLANLFAPKTDEVEELRKEVAELKKLIESKK